MELTYHKQLEVLHVGCEKPRAYFVPFSDKKDAANINRALSDRFVSLCGEWDAGFVAPCTLDKA